MSNVNIRPTNHDFVASLPCPNAIFNIAYLITEHIERRKDIEKHVHSMLEYDLDYIGPSQRYCNVIDAILEDMGCSWRIHSSHIMQKTETVRMIIRKASLIDLTQERIELHPYELQLWRIMRDYGTRYPHQLDKINTPDLDDMPMQYKVRRELMTPGPCNVAIFRLSSPNKYYWMFSKQFAVWEYSDDHPEVGWQPYQENK